MKMTMADMLCTRATGHENQGSTDVTPSDPKHSQQVNDGHLMRYAQPWLILATRSVLVLPHANEHF